MPENLEDAKIDIADIFGEDAILPAQTDASDKDSASDKVSQSASITGEEEDVLKQYEAKQQAKKESLLQAKADEKERAILEAYERGRLDAEKKHKTKPKAENPSASPIDNRISDFLEAYDKLREILYFKISPVVGDKATKTMLTRSFDKARAQYPDILLKVNLDEAGKPLEDGKLSQQVLGKNLNSVPSDMKWSQLIDVLRHLLRVRLNAVQKGLGQQVTLGIVRSMKTQIEDMNDMYPADVLKSLAALVPNLEAKE